jgi:hypothetical protein
VALVTVFPGDFPISDDSTAMTFITGEAVIEYKSVVESYGFIIHKSFFGVAMGAIIYLRIMLAFLEMTDEAGALCDRDVFSLDDLGVTARALKTFPPFEIFEMDFVIEGYVLERNLTFKESLIMTPFCQTVFIADFCPRFGFDIKFCPVATHHDKSLDLFSQNRSHSSRWGIMACTAFELTVGGCFPTCEERLHVMARGAKARMRCEFHRTNKENDND